MPPGIDNLRVGESIIQGLNTINRDPLLPDLHLDAFVLRAPIIECAVKPSRPFGDVGQDAFGGHQSWPDRGLRRRALLALGRQDVTPGFLRPVDPRVEVLGLSSDHLITDVEGVRPVPRVGMFWNSSRGLRLCCRRSPPPMLRRSSRAVRLPEGCW